MVDILEDIITARKQQLAVSQAMYSMTEIENQLKHAPSPRGFSEALIQDEGISIIAEMKQKSPSAGKIRENYAVNDIARAYEEGGAKALSVLTESERFGGKIQDLQMVRCVSHIPILRKDFIFDPYQVVEARAFGADAILLIADILSPNQLKELVALARSHRMDALVEVFTTSSIPSALNSGSDLIGINTRNLRTLEMKPDNIALLSQMIPKERTLVAESGFKSPEDLQSLKALHVSAVLVGEALLKQIDLKQAVRNLVDAGRRS